MRPSKLEPRTDWLMWLVVAVVIFGVLLMVTDEFGMASRLHGQAIANL